jgi:hypothetical protein
MGNRYIVDRGLPERAKLSFYFPNTSEGEEYFVVNMPFFENFRVRERKKARLSRYNLISRSSNLYSYLGADSRRLDLDFNITLDHLLTEHPDLNIEKYNSAAGAINPEAEKLKFLKPLDAGSLEGSLAGDLTLAFRDLENVKASARQVFVSEWAKHGMTDAEADYLKVLYDISNDDVNAVRDAEITARKSAVNAANTFLSKSVELMGGEGAPVFEATKPQYPQSKLYKFEKRKADAASEARVKILDTIIYWVNIIRSSVTNNSKNPIFGPPIVRFNFGLLYQDIPCICTNYTIGYNESAGFDLQTLLPRQLRITMNLEELRAGDFGDFRPESHNQVERDNLAGWEAVISNQTSLHTSMDPGSYGRLM